MPCSPSTLRRSAVPRVALACCAAGLTAAIGVAHARQAAAPAKPRQVNAAELKRLDARTEEVRESFLRDTTKLITSYEEAGQLERARTLLDALSKLDPQNEPFRARLAALGEQILDANEFEIDLEPGKSWQAVGMVTKGQTVRIRVSGEYKLGGVFSVGPDGMETGHPAEELVAGVQPGAVMGVVAPADPAVRPGSNGPGDKPPQPFKVGASYQRPADRDGRLYLKANVPPGGRCTGRLTAKISGVARP
jgi:hypothetical protein